MLKTRHRVTQELNSGRNPPCLGRQGQLHRRGDLGAEAEAVTGSCYGKTIAYLGGPLCGLPSGLANTKTVSEMSSPSPVSS